MSNNTEITPEYLDKIIIPYKTPIVDPMTILSDTIKECKTEKSEKEDGK